MKRILYIHSWLRSGLRACSSYSSKWRHIRRVLRVRVQICLSASTCRYTMLKVLLTYNNKIFRLTYNLTQRRMFISKVCTDDRFLHESNLTARQPHRARATSRYTGRGVHSPWDHDAFPPCFRFPPIFEKLLDSVENFPNCTFSRQIFRFSSAKISDDFFFSHRPQISNFPLFQYISPLFR